MRGAHAAGVPFRVGEGNSVSCGGRAGVSDVFGTALWALDWLLAFATIGVDMVNFHGGVTGHYTAVAFPDLPSSTVPDVRPLFYGLWAATVATANASSVWEATVESSNDEITAYALRDADGVYRVALIHVGLDAATAADVVIAPPDAGASPGALMRLVAGSNASATRGVSWNGMTFDGSADGLPIGEPSPEVVARSADGAFRFSLPPRSAAVLVF